MEEPFHQAGQEQQEEPHSSPEDSSFQHVQDTEFPWQPSRMETWDLHQELHEHHQIVQRCYEALDEAISTGQETKTLWKQYHEAIKQHRLLVNRFRLATRHRVRDMLHRIGRNQLP